MAARCWGGAGVLLPPLPTPLGPTAPVPAAGATWQEAPASAASAERLSQLLSSPLRGTPPSLASRSLQYHLPAAAPAPLACAQPLLLQHSHGKDAPGVARAVLGGSWTRVSTAGADTCPHCSTAALAPHKRVKDTELGLQLSALVLSSLLASQHHRGLGSAQPFLGPCCPAVPLRHSQAAFRAGSSMGATGVSLSSNATYTWPLPAPWFLPMPGAPCASRG